MPEGQSGMGTKVLIYSLCPLGYLRYGPVARTQGA
jgi:hypothetical protein